MNPVILPGLPTKNPSPEQIIKAVCITCNVSADQLKSTNTKRYLSEARSICAGLIFKYNPKITLKQFGAMVNRDHSTIVYSKKIFNNLLQTDEGFQRKVLTVEQFLA